MCHNKFNNIDVHNFYNTLTSSQGCHMTCHKKLVLIPMETGFLFIVLAYFSSCPWTVMVSMLLIRDG